MPNPLDLATMAQNAAIDLIAYLPATKAKTYHHFNHFITEGRHAGMRYLAHQPQRRIHPRGAWPPAQAMLLCAVILPPPTDALAATTGPLLARYAHFMDYHRWLPRRLESLGQMLAARFPDLNCKVLVDTGPLLERDFAAQAGIGWVGKNNLIVHPDAGSHLLLGVLLLDRALPCPTHPPVDDRCGHCRRCLDACPTGALIKPYTLDASRCIAYLTSQHRGPIPEALRPLMGTHLWGCDRCQEVCPHNRHPQPPRQDPPQGKLNEIPLRDFLLSPPGMRRRLSDTVMARANLTQLAHLATVVMANLKDPSAVPHLEVVAHNHPTATLREHAAWALDHLTIPPAKPSS